MLKASGGVAALRKMAAGKKRVDNFQWQIQVTNNEEWEELLQRKGLIVIDVYQDWCGPCTAMAGHLKEIKLQLGDDLLHCALAKADTIDQLEKFRGRSEPTWLFLADGQPVDIIKGANAPLIRQTILNELEQEKRVMANLHQRNTISWDSIEFPVEATTVEEEEDGDEADKDPLIPPDWDKMDAILLRGSYQIVVDDIEKRFGDISLEIAHTSEVTLRGEESNSLILWITSDPDEDESFIESVDSILKEAIHNSLNQNRSPEASEEAEQPETQDQPEQEEDPKEEEDQEEEDHQEEEEQQQQQQQQQKQPEEKPPVKIEYRLIFGSKEVEELVLQCQPADPDESVPDNEETPADNEQPEEVEEAEEKPTEAQEEES